MLVCIKFKRNLLKKRFLFLWECLDKMAEIGAYHKGLPINFAQTQLRPEGESDELSDYPLLKLF